ncbi:MAG: LutC/YkgG family protein [Steroidobacteraceae bacterium]
MSSRDEILGTIRANLPKLDRPLPHVPLFDAAAPASLLAHFKESLLDMGGDFLDVSSGGDPLQPIRARLAAAKVVCSATPEVAGNRELSSIRAPRDLADVDIGVARAAFGVAETGSVCFTEQSLGVNSLGYLPQHLIVLLDPADIVINLHHAYRRPEFLKGHYAVFQTGPSATADIEGVLIHGAQGVRSLTVVPLARTANNAAQ